VFLSSYPSDGVHANAVGRQVEITVRQMLVVIGAECLGAHLTAQGADYPPERVPCSCGAEAQYHSRRQAMAHSTLGK
jgi:hypothetical protein